MNLRDGVFQVRAAFTEMRSRFLSDTEIIIWLNTSAKIMCQKAQNLQSFFTFNTKIYQADDINDPNVPAVGSGSYQQEYALPIDVDGIIGAAYFKGVVLPLKMVDRELVQVGGRVSGNPFYCYIKEFTRTLTSQVAGGTIQQIALTGELSEQYRTVIGLYPVPAANIPIYLWYIERHKQMKNAMDTVGVPDAYALPWYAYAVARAKEKEGAVADATYWQQIHDKGTDEFVQWAADNMNQISPPYYSHTALPSYVLGGSSSVIIVAQNVSSIGH